MATKMKRASRTQAGFTMIEIMITVVILGVLAKLALAGFSSSTRKTHTDVEVTMFFTELALREQQYQSEHGVYLATGATETAMFPASPSESGQTLGTLPATWTTLKVKPAQTTDVKCAYVVMAGGPSTTAGAMATTNFSYARPAKNWFYMLARCKMDGNSAVDTYYFASSDNPVIQKLRPGN
jgi:prepilin-type N-terminal cleavage/methylation domain-containing protein